MVLKKSILALAISLVCISFAAEIAQGQARRPSQQMQAHLICGNNEKNCKDINNQCKCFCSKICKPRDKKKGDSPVFYPNDEYGNYCYCNQWDYDNYLTRQCQNVSSRNK